MHMHQFDHFVKIFDLISPQINHSKYGIPRILREFDADDISDEILLLGFQLAILK